MAETGDWERRLAERAGAATAADFRRCPSSWARLALGEAPTPQWAALQYLPEFGEVLAWRQMEIGGRSCLLLDHPQALALSASAARGLEHALQRHHRRIADAALHIEVETPPPHPIERAPIGLPPPLPGARPRLPSGQRIASGCPQTPPRGERESLFLSEALRAPVARVRGHHCPGRQTVAAGSGLLLAPDLLLSAAHVMIAADGGRCVSYRVVPGGLRFDADAPAPFGVYRAFRMQESGRGGWQVGMPRPGFGDDRLAARIQGDQAWLRLARPTQLPEATAWPLLRFGVREAPPIATRVLKVGYPRHGVYGEVRVGAPAATYGRIACARGPEAHARFALPTDLGDSGAPILLLPADQPQGRLELLSLATFTEVHAREVVETLGPHFDLHDYALALQALREEAGGAAGAQPLAFAAEDRQAARRRNDRDE